MKNTASVAVVLDCDRPKDIKDGFIVIDSVVSKDVDGCTLKTYNDLTCYPSHFFSTRTQTAEAKIIDYVVGQLGHLNVDSDMIQISEETFAM